MTDVPERWCTRDDPMWAAAQLSALTPYMVDVILQVDEDCQRYGEDRVDMNDVRAIASMLRAIHRNA